jgi:energy-coupling factor transporter ATP-binding protein EcfA2
MAHITKLVIEGLLGRKEPIEVNLDRTVNVFFGENGCGKTTLLKILRSALAQDGEAMISLPVERAEVDIFSVTDQRIFSYVWDRKNSRSKNDVSAEQQRLVFGGELTSFERARYLSLRSSESNWKVIGSKKPKDIYRRTWSHYFLPTTRIYSTDSSRRTPEQRLSVDDQLNEAFAESVNKRWLLY